MIWLILASLALGGKKKKDDEPAGPDPDAIAAAETEACRLDVPENFSVRTGFATHEDEAEAIDLARAEAKREAISSLCSGKSTMRCDVIQRHIEQWKDPFYNPLTQRACAHVGVRRDWIDDDKREQEALQKAIEDLSIRIVEAAPTGRPIAVRPPVWADTGCDGGPLGIVVFSAVRNAFGAAQRNLVGVGSPGASEVNLVLKSAGPRTIVDAGLRVVGKNSVLPVPGIDVAADLFPRSPKTSTCWLDSQMGLPNGQRDGRNGLRVRIDTRLDAEVCEGDRSTPLIHVNQPARVKVYSVDRTGTGYLIWPPPGGSDLVTRSASLGEMSYVRSTVEGEERLVAVAVPKGERFAEIDDWTAFCKHPDPFSVSPWPEAAASASALAVKPWDDPACLTRNVQRASPVQMPDVPYCPQRLGE